MIKNDDPQHECNLGNCFVCCLFYLISEGKYALIYIEVAYTNKLLFICTLDSEKKKMQHLRRQIKFVVQIWDTRDFFEFFSHFFLFLLAR